MIDGAHRLTLKAGALAFTAYELGQGPLVLCLHGFPDTPATWGRLLPDLAAAGYRAVAVTSRGYEPSSQPADGDYSLAALSQDVIDWIDALGADRAHLIGHDWGSSISHIAAARAPERIDSLAALAVPHPGGFGAVVAGDFEQLARSWYIFFFQMRGFADLVLEANNWALLEALWRRWSPGWAPPADVVGQLRTTFGRPGVKDAALAYYRTSFDAAHLRGPETADLSARPLTVPTLGLYGANDGCIGPDVFEGAMPPALFAAGRVLERWPDAGHFLHLEHPERTAERLVHWLRGQAA